MTRIRNRTQDKYTIVSSTITKNKDLSLRDRGMLVTLLSLPDNWQFSVAGLSKIFNHDGKDRIRASIQTLERMGYLQRRKIKCEDTGQYIGSEWEIYDIPQKVTANPLLDNPSLDYPPTDYPTQYNINNINNTIYYDDDVRARIYTQIDYPYLYGTLDVIGRNILQDVVDDMIDVYINTSDTICIKKGESYTAEHVRAKYDTIDADIMMHIIERLRNANIGTDARAYIRTTTYNATKTIDTQYNADARHGR